VELTRRSVSSGSPFEGLIGFSRAVRVGPTIVVSATAPVGADGRIVAGDAYLQGRRCLEIIDRSLSQLGSGLEDVVRTRVYLVDMGDLGRVARAHQEAFGEIGPASSFLRVAGVVDAGWRVEIEADAIVDDD